MRVNFNTTISNNQVFCKPKIQSVSKIQNSSASAYMTLITFGSGFCEDGKPIIYGAECNAGAKSGGVAAVVTDLGATNYEVTPYYGGRVCVKCDATGKVDELNMTLVNRDAKEQSKLQELRKQNYKIDHVDVLTAINDKGVKQPVFIHPDALYEAGGDVRKVPPNKIQWLEEVSSKDIETASGKEKAVLYRVLQKGDTKGAERFYVFTQGTAAMSKAYEDAGFSYSSKASILGEANPYAVNSNAFVELLPDMAQKGYKPKCIVLNDPQTAYAGHFISDRILNHDEFFKNAKVSYICHNAGRGYQQISTLRSMFLSLAKPDEIQAIEKSKIYQQAKDYPMLENLFFKHFMPTMMDTDHNTSGLLLALRLRQNGFLNYIGTVAPGAAESYCVGRGDSGGVKEILKDLYNKGLFQGILNGLNNEGIDPRQPIKLDYYQAAAMAKLEKDMQTTTPGFTLPECVKTPFETFDPDKMTMDQIIDIKQRNTLNLFRRINAVDSPEKYPYVVGKKVKGVAKVCGKIDDNLIKILEANQNISGDKKELVDLFVSWGRADDQKGLDIAIESFKRFIHKAAEEAGGDINKSKAKNAVLVMGGPIGDAYPELKTLIRGKVESILSADPLMKGRFVFLDGFAPASVFANACTFDITPSRWAPCELVDHEARKYCGIPIVTGIEGLADKNFDIRNPKEYDIATGFKTEHNNLITLDEIQKELEFKDSMITSEKATAYTEGIKKRANDGIIKIDVAITKQETAKSATLKSLTNAKNEFEKVVKELKDAASDELKNSIASTEKTLSEAIENDNKLDKILWKLYNNNKKLNDPKKNEIYRKEIDTRFEKLKKEKIKVEKALMLAKEKDEEVLKQLIESLSAEQRNKYEAAKQALEQATSNFESAEIALNDLKQQKEVLVTEITQAQDIQKKISRRHKLETSIEKLQSEHSKIEKELTEAKNKKNAAEKIIIENNIENASDNAKNVVKDAQKDRNAANKLIEKLEGQLTESKNKIDELQNALSPIKYDLSKISEESRKALDEYKQVLDELIKKTTQELKGKWHFNEDGTYTPLLTQEDIDHQIAYKIQEELNKKLGSELGKKRQAAIDSVTNDDLAKIYDDAIKLGRDKRKTLMEHNWKMLIRWEDNVELQRINIKGKLHKTYWSAKELYNRWCYEGAVAKPSSRIFKFDIETLRTAEDFVKEKLAAIKENLKEEVDNATKNNFITPGKGRRFEPKLDLSFSEKYLTKQNALIATGAVAIAGLAYYLLKPAKNEQPQKVDENAKRQARIFTA